jgi:hypothetical protein
MKPLRIFLKIRGDVRSSRCTTDVVDTGGKWKKSSVINVLIILFGYPVSTTLAKLVAKSAASVIDTGGAPYLANISENFRKNSKQNGILWGWG